MAFWSKRTKPEVAATPNPAATQALLVAMARQVGALENRLALLEGAPVRKEESRSEVKDWLPVIDRMQEIALVAMQAPDLAQQFGLTARQQAHDEEEALLARGEKLASDTWDTPIDGVTYGE